eukprot:10429271-Alexandrium_andersonii.AAC.1
MPGGDVGFFLFGRCTIQWHVLVIHTKPSAAPEEKAAAQRWAFESLRARGLTARCIAAGDWNLEEEELDFGLLAATEGWKVASPG